MYRTLGNPILAVRSIYYDFPKFGTYVVSPVYYPNNKECPNRLHLYLTTPLYHSSEPTYLIENYVKLDISSIIKSTEKIIPGITKDSSTKEETNSNIIGSSPNIEFPYCRKR